MRTRELASNTAWLIAFVLMFFVAAFLSPTESSMIVGMMIAASGFVFMVWARFSPDEN